MSQVSTTPSQLAIDGGSPVRTQGWAPWPFFDKEELAAVEQVLRSGKVNYWTGETGRQFEKEFATSVQTKHAIALANGTVALELALKVLGIGAGAEVIVPSRSFLATASCVPMCGAVPVFADVDPNSQNITAETIAPLITPRTKGIIVVHLAGGSCEMDAILALAKKHQLRVIEDCAQGQGARYKNRPLGSIGDIGTFSFCQDKIMTTGGEGGMLTTNDSELWNQAWSFKDHGKSWEACYNRPHPQLFRWLHESLGTNWRLSEIQSAIGRVALAKVPGWVETRRRYAGILNQHFAEIDALRISLPPEHVYHSYYKYYAFLRPERLREGWTADRIARAIQAEGIPCGTGSCSEMYLEKVFQDLGYAPAERLPVAKELGETSLMFQVHPTLSEKEVQQTGEAVRKVLSAASR